MSKYHKYASQGGLLDNYSYNSSSSIAAATGITGNGKYYNEKHLLRIRFRQLAVITVSLPLFGFIFCVLWAIYYDYDGATRTHCGVPNYLPSLSAAIGNYELSDAVWKICIVVHAIPRFCIAGIYFNYFTSVIHQRFSAFVVVTVVFYVLENIGLVLLALVSSDVDFEFHKNCFIIFMFSSFVYMLMSCLLLSNNTTRNISPNSIEIKSLQFKLFLLVVNVVFIILTCYTYYRHNTYCEPGMYTIFALFEYIVILSNMGFHMTAYWDFYDKVWTMGSTSKLNWKLPITFRWCNIRFVKSFQDRGKNTQELKLKSSIQLGSNKAFVLNSK